MAPNSGLVWPDQDFVDGEFINNILGKAIISIVLVVAGEIYYISPTVINNITDLILIIKCFDKHNQLLQIFAFKNWQPKQKSMYGISLFWYTAKMYLHISINWPIESNLIKDYKITFLSPWASSENDTSNTWKQCPCGGNEWVVCRKKEKITATIVDEIRPMINQFLGNQQKKNNNTNSFRFLAMD